MGCLMDELVKREKKTCDDYFRFVCFHIRDVSDLQTQLGRHVRIPSVTLTRNSIVAGETVQRLKALGISQHQMINVNDLFQRTLVTATKNVHILVICKSTGDFHQA